MSENNEATRSMKSIGEKQTVKSQLNMQLKWQELGLYNDLLNEISCRPSTVFK